MQLKCNKYLVFALFISSCVFQVWAGGDTLKNKIPKHYFNTTIYTDYYSTKMLDMDYRNRTNKNINNHLKTYQFKQISGGFFVPVYTKDVYRSDSTISNWHALLTGGYVVAKPIFGGIQNHDILKGSFGGRVIYNSGKKNVFYYEATPFFTQDLKTKDQLQWRFASTFVYDRIVNDYLSFKLGFTKTYILGNRFRLPYLGFRVGKLDKVYLSVQFPKRMVLSFPMGNKFRGNFYTKPMGGLYNLSNSDSLYPGSDKTIVLGRYELTHGFRLDFVPSKNFGMFVALGVISKNALGMFSVDYNKSTKGLLSPFYTQNLGGNSYLNIGLTIHLGKTRKVYNNQNLYEIMDLNNSSDATDGNSDILNTNIPKVNTKSQKVSIQEIDDVIDAQDLY